MTDLRREELWDALGLGPRWVLRGKDAQRVSESASPQSAQAAPPRASAGTLSTPPEVPFEQTPLEEFSESVRSPESQSVKQGLASEGVQKKGASVGWSAQAPSAPKEKSAPNKGRLSRISGSDGRGVTGEAFDSQRIIRIQSAGWEELQKLVTDCQACQIAQGRTQAVFGEGGLKRRLFLVGEAPGAQEDLEGRPFVGASGKLLDNILFTCRIDRKEIGIFNTLKCRPPLNRTPEKEEMQACRPFLERQIELADPELIVALGIPAATWFLGEIRSLGSARGRVYDVTAGGKKRKLIVTYHPSYYLRSPMEKRRAWEDWCLVMDTLG